MAFVRVVPCWSPAGPEVVPSVVPWVGPVGDPQAVDGRGTPWGMPGAYGRGRFCSVADRQPIQVTMCESTARVPPEILQTVQQHLEETARTLAQMDPGNSL